MLVQLEHVRKKYGSFTLELNMQIPEDRIIGLIGANGAGKSTTFKLMLELIRPDQGTVEVLGRNAADLGAEEKLEIGAVFSDRLFRISESTAAYSGHEPLLSGFSGKRVS